MIGRFIADKIKDLLEKFPVVTLAGVRQCGKSTLLKNLLPDYKYISLEVPELFSYIQTKVDEVNHPGMYVLSGSSLAW